MKLPTLGKIDLDLNGSQFSLDLDQYFGHEYGDIGEASTELPAILEWVNSQLHVLTERKIIVKQEIKEAEARAFFDLKEGLFESQGLAGKTTDASVSMAVCLQPSVKDSYREYATLCGWSQRLQNLMNELQLKIDLIRSTEATRRKLTDDSET
jgi:hypothetical protein